MAKIKSKDRVVEDMISSLRATNLKKSEKKASKPTSFAFVDPFDFVGSQGETLTKEVAKEHEKAISAASPLVKSILNVLNGGKDDSIERLAFESNPYISNNYQGLYRRKLRLLPDDVLKRISIQDDLVASIVNTRSNQLSAFGRPQPDRFTSGFQVEAEPGFTEHLDSAAKERLQERIKRVEELLMTCGQTRGYTDNESLSFGQYLFMQTRNAVIFGRCATEVIYTEGLDGKRKFHSFRPIDAGTIYRASPQKDAADAVRREALNILSQLKNKKLIPERFVNDEYAWVQVIEGRPMQAFTPEECLVHNFYPVTDIELDGYPVTPLDTVISAVTTHINITTHNKLYFQSGRASRGMIVFKSDDVDETIVARIRQQFMASINSVGNSWRMPIFNVGIDDEIGWFPIDNSSRDMEFQYLSDSNARVIMSAFQMSPEELAGYGHLCLSPDTMVWTNKGAMSIGALLGGEAEAGGFSVWTGSGFAEARAFVTGDRQVCRTSTSNGITLTTSPEHRFRIVDESGDLVWKRQEELKIGDTLLVNRHPVKGFAGNIPSYRGRKLTVEMMEVLGWLTGDGSISVRKQGKVKHSKLLEFYYHHIKEQDIRSRHLSALQAFGLDPKVVDRQVSSAAVQRQKNLYGFTSVASIKTMLKLYDTEFVGWLLEQGFKPSSERKAVPSFVHGLPVEYRSAYLRGFFSADGSKDKLNTPSITISDPVIREETKRLLLNMGIRTRNCEGTTKASFVKKEDGTGFNQVYVKEANRLIVKDKKEFYDRIGFLQAYKQPNTAALENSDCRWDKVAKSVAHALANRIIADPALNGVERDSVRHILKDPLYPFQARLKVLAMAEKYGQSMPAWVNDFYQESVIGLETGSETMEMVDIEVFDDTHAFMADGVVVHNSRGTNSQALSESSSEYKLEAARDVGIRPLIGNMQNYVNQRILPLIDPELAQHCAIKFVGLEVDTPEKEAIRLQSEMAVHMNMDEVLEQVEKKPIGKRYGGQINLNPQWQAKIDAYVMVGDIMEHFFGIEGASKDPRFQYLRDPMYFQWQQFLMQQQQLQQQQQMQAQQAQQQQQGQGQPGQGQGQQPQQGQDQNQQPQDLTRSADQLLEILNKSEMQLPAGKRALLLHQRKVVSHALDAFEADAKSVIDELLADVEKTLPPKLKKD